MEPIVPLTRIHAQATGRFESGWAGMAERTEAFDVDGAHRPLPLHSGFVPCPRRYASRACNAASFNWTSIESSS